MKTKLFLLFVALIATMSVFAYDFKYGDLYYNITGYSTAEVTYQEDGSSDNYSGLTSVIIPESVTYNGTTYGVTSIGWRAFQGCSSLKSITIPDGVTSIGSDAFYGCSGLTSVTIPDGVTSIGESAFQGCSGLTSITIPNSVTSIGDYAFSHCSGLTSITIPNSVTSIGDYAFWGCRSLTTVAIPNSVTSIGSFAFYGCSGLTSITIPNSVTSIEDGAFDGCSGLTSITIPNGVTSIGSGAFSGCSGLTSVTIPNSVTSIGQQAFASCSGLMSVTIPNSVTTIEFQAFHNVLNIVYSGTAIGSPWGARNFNGYVDGYLIYFDVTKTVLLACYSAATGMITIPNSVTTIGSSAFSGCNGLTSVTIPDSVTSVGSRAFYGCSNLETVTFGSGLQNIGDNAFKGCQNIYEMTVYATQVPNVVAEKEGSTDYGTFQGVSKLAELHVPAESVKKYKIHPVWGLFNVITAIPYQVTLLCDNVQGVVVGSGSYQPNEQVTITAKPNVGYRFVQWSDGITTNPRTIVVSSDTTLTAEFEEIPASEYTVSVVVDPTQHGTVQMTLTAVPDEGYQFTRWSDGNTENPRTILVTENMTLSATFNLSTKASNASADESQDGTRKVFRDGQMYIIRGEKTYTATGSQL